MHIYKRRPSGQIGAREISVPFDTRLICLRSLLGAFALQPVMAFRVLQDLHLAVRNDSACINMLDAAPVQI